MVIAMVGATEIRHGGAMVIRHSGCHGDMSVCHNLLFFFTYDELYRFLKKNWNSGRGHIINKMIRYYVLRNI